MTVDSLMVLEAGRSKSRLCQGPAPPEAVRQPLPCLSQRREAVSCAHMALVSASWSHRLVCLFSSLFGSCTDTESGIRTHLGNPGWSHLTISRFFSLSEVVFRAVGIRMAMPLGGHHSTRCPP